MERRELKGGNDCVRHACWFRLACEQVKAHGHQDRARYAGANFRCKQYEPAAAFRIFRHNSVPHDARLNLPAS